MTARIQYEKEINTSEDYNISLSDFVNWLKETANTEKFMDLVKKNDIYETAVDFSIPIIIVKYFTKKA